jgi:hypothetical protein
MILSVQINLKLRRAYPYWIVKLLNKSPFGSPKVLKKLSQKLLHAFSLVVLAKDVPLAYAMA